MSLSCQHIWQYFVSITVCPKAEVTIPTKLQLYCQLHCSITSVTGHEWINFVWNVCHRFFQCIICQNYHYRDIPQCNRQHVSLLELSIYEAWLPSVTFRGVLLIYYVYFWWKNVTAMKSNITDEWYARSKLYFKCNLLVYKLHLIIAQVVDLGLGLS